MSWWSSNPLDELIDKATSETLPSGFEDWALTLEICDQIRSKSVAPRDAMKALKRRLENKNPNVQLSTLRVVTNAEVRSKILELMQSWAMAFQGKPHLHYVEDSVKALKYQGMNSLGYMHLIVGFEFPQAQQISASFVDTTAVPPEWIDSDVCMRCRTPFTFTNRKHHCRNCGNVFCGSCSGKTIPLPRLGIIQPVRVCDGCHIIQTEPRNTPKLKSHTDLRPPQVVSTPHREVDEDEDLKTALRLSLEDSAKIDLSSKPAPARSNNYQQKSTSTFSDDDLEAAIQASLRDVEESKKKTNEPPVQPVVYNSPSSKSIGSHDLSPVETENITLFSTLIERMKSAPVGTVTKEPQVQELHDSIGALRPKLARALAETLNKHEALLKMHAQIGKAVHSYDLLLEKRFAMTTVGRQNRYPSFALSTPQQHLPQRIPNATSSSYFNDFDTSHNQREPFGYSQQSLEEVRDNKFSSASLASQYPASTNYKNFSPTGVIPRPTGMQNTFSSYYQPPNNPPPYQNTQKDIGGPQSISVEQQPSSTFQDISQMPEYYSGLSNQHVAQRAKQGCVEEVSLIDL